MKKYIISLILLAVSFILAPFSYQKVQALDTPNIETIYPENILDYTDLTNISLFDINSEYIVYTLDKETLTLFNLSTKQYLEIAGFNNIKKIKITSNKVLIADSDKIRIADLNNIDNNINNLEHLSEINLQSLKAIDIYVSKNKIFIATICNNTFKLYKYDLDLNSDETNPVKTSDSSYFENVRLMTINSNNAYIVYGISGLCILNYSSQEPVIKDTFKPNATVIDTFYYNEKEYLLTFTNEILYLLDSSGVELTSVTIESQDKNITDHFPILKVTDINFFNNKIFVSDSEYKTIQTFDIINEDETVSLISKEIILCSNSNDKGRFNNVNDIYIQGSTIFTADTGNNRIHYLRDNKSYFINGLEVGSNPHSVLLDKFNNLYFIKNTNTHSILCKYKFENNNYTKVKEYSSINSDTIGFVSDICVTNSNNIYMLDYTNDELVYMTSNGLESHYKLSSLNLSSDSQIEYLKALDLLVIRNNSSIYLFNQIGTEISSTILNNCTEITVDYDKIYARCNDTLKLITINDNELNISEEQLTIPNSDRVSKLTFDIVDRKIYGFDSKRSCLVKFDCNLTPNPFITPNINNPTPLTTNDTILALNIKYSCLIYDYPYALGNYYNSDDSITTCIGIGEYNEYYQILFNNCGELKIGYIPKSNVEIINYNYKPINVITTNQIVPAYKYPTILKYNNERLINKSFDINTKLTLLYMFPISIDDKAFYLFKEGNNIGFIFSIDIVLDENTNIKNLNTENAKISLLSDTENITYIYKEDKSTKIISIENNTRIYVDNYDKNSEYTKIIYKDSDLNTYEGYVETKYIQMDKLDNTELVLVIIIILSIILLVMIAIAYIVIRRKNK